MATIKVRRGLRSSMPALELGELGFSVDTKELFIGTSQGNLKLSNLHFVGSSTPMGASNGDLWFNTSTNTLSVYVNGSWIPVGGEGGGQGIPNSLFYGLLFFFGGE